MPMIFFDWSYLIHARAADVLTNEQKGLWIEEVDMQTPIIEQFEGIVEELAPVCRHHWLIDTPHGATSTGRCKVCGEIREFRNSAADTLWEGDPMASISKMGGGANRPVVAGVAPGLNED
jgi:hypothetical protein